MYEDVAKSLSWLSNMFPEVHPVKDDSDKLSNCIHTYCANGAEAIARLSAFNIMWQEAAKIAEEERPSWISVYERLPDKRQIVIATDGEGTWDYGMFRGLAFSLSKGEYHPDEWEWKKHTIKHVKWWMPKDSALPEPPKEET